MRKVAVTGQIGAGKSTVCRLLKELGAYTLSADEIVHEILLPDTDLGKRVLSLFGPDSVKEGQFDKTLISNKVFQNRALLLQLEMIVHPEVEKRISFLYEKVKDCNYTLFVCEVPLLFEAGMESQYDDVIYVKASLRARQSRFQKNHFKEREERLLPDAVKEAKNPFIIENNGSLEELSKAVLTVYSQII